ncbi:ParB/RepB/Spo0J family partition protein [Persicobacter diffluens]|uniref:ParB/Sulfiredoxin domain-containing protein n=1 Tax=Persicobacter diffluens TaxID=981 RepID=A0AAN4W4J1_9BACT|nr:hypothetical protein PEDI_55540 [Persicobacter diffluens]
MAKLVRKNKPNPDQKRSIVGNGISIDIHKTPPTALEVLPLFEQFIHPLSKSEFSNLKASIEKDGEIFDPIKVWDTGSEKFVIDGHHRLKIAKSLGFDQVPFRSIKALETRDDALEWMAKNQLSRRNITPMMTSFLRGIQLQKSSDEETTQEIAQKLGVSKRTLENDRNVFLALEAIGKENAHWKDYLILTSLEEAAISEQEQAALSRVKKGDLEKLGVLLNKGEQIEIPVWLGLKAEEKAPKLPLSNLDKYRKQADRWLKSAEKMEQEELQKLKELLEETLKRVEEKVVG